MTTLKTIKIGTEELAFRRVKGGLVLLDIDRRPFAALIIRPTSAWFVTAGVLKSGRTFFMQGIGAYTAKALGLAGMSEREQEKTAQDIARQFRPVVTLELE